MDIKNVIEREADTWSAGDVVKMKTCWEKLPQTTQWASLLDDAVIFCTAEPNDSFAIMVGTIPQKLMWTELTGILELRVTERM